MYNPDRFRGPQRRRTTNAAAGQSVFEPVSWEDAESALAERIRALVAGGNADRIAVVTPLLSGTLDALVDRWAAAVGGARRLRYEAFAYEPMRAAHGIAFDRASVPCHDFGRADLIVSFGADFLKPGCRPSATPVPTRMPDAPATGERCAPSISSRGSR